MSRMVSVIVPIYNAEQYLERCLNSLVNQSYKNIEIILVDDGSTDGSGRICRDFCAKDERMHLLQQDNQGPDMARKTGLMESGGDLIAFVDADDYLAQDAFEIMYKAYISNAADLVCSQISRFNSDGKLWDGSKTTGETVIIEFPADAMKAYFESNLLIGTYYAKLISRQLIEKYPFVAESVIGEDITAALYMYENAKRIVIIPDICYFYFWNESSISHSGYTDRHLTSLKNYICVRDRIAEGNYVDKKVVCGYFAEYEMAVATAMSRNWTYNIQASDILRNDLRTHWKDIKANDKTPMYMKICMMLFMHTPRFFMFLYKGIYILTGR